MSNAPKLPDLLPPPSRQPRWQFGLWYLFLLMTIIAATVGLMRSLLDHPGLAIGALVYVLGFGSYLVLRLPWLIALGSPERQRLRENRRRLAEWAKKKRRES